MDVRHLTTRLLLVIAVAGAAVASAGPALGDPPLQTESGSALSGRAELTPDAGALGADTESALRAYWTPQRRAAAVDSDVLTVDKAPEPTAARPTGAPGRVEPSPAPPRPPRSPIADDQAVAGGQAATWPFRGDQPATSIGRVFYYDLTLKKSGSCSAAVVQSEGRNLVWTAGHCVHGGKGGKWHANWVFYPHYHHGPDPTYGMWHGIQAWSWTDWIYNSDLRYDFGAMLMGTNEQGKRILDVTGGFGLAWNYPMSGKVYSFGYPALGSQFDGTVLKYCSNDMLPAGSNVGMLCNMTGHASGGPWLGWFNGWGGWINGHTSYRPSWDPHMYSPYYGDAVPILFNAVRWG